MIRSPSAIFGSLPEGDRGRVCSAQIETATVGTTGGATEGSADGTVGTTVGTTGGSTGATVGVTGGSTGATVGVTEGSTGGTVGTTGASVGTITADAVLKGADVGVLVGGRGVRVGLSVGDDVGVGVLVGVGLGSTEGAKVEVAPNLGVEVTGTSGGRVASAGAVIVGSGVKRANSGCPARTKANALNASVITTITVRSKPKIMGRRRMGAGKQRTTSAVALSLRTCLLAALRSACSSNWATAA